jgi:hypothetical protein
MIGSTSKIPNSRTQARLSTLIEQARDPVSSRVKTNQFDWIRRVPGHRKIATAVVKTAAATFAPIIAVANRLMFWPAQPGAKSWNYAWSKILTTPGIFRAIPCGSRI